MVTFRNDLLNTICVQECHLYSKFSVSHYEMNHTVKQAYFSSFFFFAVAVALGNNYSCEWYTSNNSDDPKMNHLLDLSCFGDETMNTINVLKFYYFHKVDNAPVTLITNHVHLCIYNGVILISVLPSPSWYLWTLMLLIHHFFKHIMWQFFGWLCHTK